MRYCRLLIHQWYLYFTQNRVPGTVRTSSTPSDLPIALFEGLERRVHLVVPVKDLLHQLVPVLPVEDLSVLLLHNLVDVL